MSRFYWRPLLLPDLFPEVVLDGVHWLLPGPVRGHPRLVTVAVAVKWIGSGGDEGRERERERERETERERERAK